MTQYGKQAKIAKSTILQEQLLIEAPELRGCPFWRWDLSPKDHQAVCQAEKGKCCFWHIIGVPEKEHLIGRAANGKEIVQMKTHGMKEYEREWYDAMLENRYIWVKKATGMGATTFFLGYMVWLCLRDDHWRGASMGIVTGPGMNLAIDEIKRIPALFKNIFYKPQVTKEWVVLNDCTITAYPSHTFDSARGLEKVRFFFVDEGDFFPKSQQRIVRGIVERYEAKTHPFVVFNSTANLPGGLYETMEQETDSIYTKIFSLVEKGIDAGIYTEYEIGEAKKSLSFPREYEGQYGIGIGNIFNYKLLDEITETYPLEASGGIRILNIDPAFGSSDTSSKFGYVGFEKRGDIKYVVDAAEIARGSPVAMNDFIISKYKAGKYSLLQVDSAFPGLIRDWTAAGLNTKGIVFREVLTDMTTNADQEVKDKKVRIHPSFSTLLSQLKAIEFNEKGHPDKKKLTFDMGDAFLMGLFYWFKRISFRKVKTKF